MWQSLRYWSASNGEETFHTAILHTLFFLRKSSNSTLLFTDCICNIPFSDKGESMSNLRHCAACCICFPEGRCPLQEWNTTNAIDFRKRSRTRAWRRKGNKMKRQAALDNLSDKRRVSPCQTWSIARRATFASRRVLVHYKNETQWMWKSFSKEAMNVGTHAWRRKGNKMKRQAAKSVTSSGRGDSKSNFRNAPRAAFLTRRWKLTARKNTEGETVSEVFFAVRIGGPGSNNYEHRKSSILFVAPRAAAQGTAIDWR